jgi:hypothetical protein
MAMLVDWIVGTKGAGAGLSVFGAALVLVGFVIVNTGLPNACTAPCTRNPCMRVCVTRCVPEKVSGKEPDFMLEEGSTAAGQKGTLGGGGGGLVGGGGAGLVGGDVGASAAGEGARPRY